MATYFIATSFGNNSIPNYYQNLAKEFVKRGHTVVMILDGKATSAVDTQSNPKQYTWPSSRPTTLKDAIFLYKLVKQYKPRYMLSNFGNVNMMTLVGWLGGVPYRAAWYQTLSEQITMDYTSFELKRTLQNIRKKFIFSLCTKVIPGSEYAKQDSMKMFSIPESKCHVLYNLLPNSLADRTYTKEKNKLVCVGRLHRSKAQDVLIQAVALLVERFPTVKVEFLGAGSEEQRYKDLATSLGISEHCVFSGQQNMDVVYERMGTAEICVVPSHIDNFPTVSFEAQAVGTPVVVSNTGGIPETMREGVTGYCLPPNDPELLAEKIALILGDEVLAKEFSANARKFFLEELSYSKLSEHADYFESMDK